MFHDMVLFQLFPWMMAWYFYLILSIPDILFTRLLKSNDQYRTLRINPVSIKYPESDVTCIPDSLQSPKMSFVTNALNHLNTYLNCKIIIYPIIAKYNLAIFNDYPKSDITHI